LEEKAKKERDETVEIEKYLEDEIRKLQREIHQIKAEKDAKESKFDSSLDQVTFSYFLNVFFLVESIKYPTRYSFTFVT